MLIIVLIALLAAGPIMSVSFGKRQEENNRKLIAFIMENYNELAGGSILTYEGAPIGYNSRLTRFRYCYSYIIMTSTRSSAVYLADGLDGDEAKNAKLTCQLITALSGWWGIPWGIVYSIQFLFSNGVKNGTNDDTVGDIMQRIRSAEEVPNS
ncbi:MAG: hypothetical protein HDT24_08430 [Ruminococcus sp.]|nr:hypothetical protein [Ruminococcus sp.]